MDYEYAVDPGAIAISWHNFRFVIGMFGFDKGRLIARFPNKWYEEVHESAKKLRERDKQRIIEALNQAKDARKVMRFGREYDPSLRDWFANAKLQNEADPFGAIITAQSEPESSNVLSMEEFDESDLIDRTQVVREIDELVAAFHHLLRFGERIAFVDPYIRIDRENRDRNTRLLLAECLKIVNRLNPRATCELHYRDKCRDRMPNISYIQEKLGRLPGFIPDDMKISIGCWRKRENPKIEFHDRYLLTEKGGLALGAGFCPCPAETTSLTYLGPSDARELLRRFDQDGTGHELVEPMLRVYSDGTTERIKGKSD